MSEKEPKPSSFSVDELDDQDLDQVAGGAGIIDGNCHTTCTNNCQGGNCGPNCGGGA